MASLKHSFARFATLLLLSLTLAACGGGDDGLDGADGATGPAGPSGPPGPSTGNGIPIDSTDHIKAAFNLVIVITAGANRFG